MTGADDGRVVDLAEAGGRLLDGWRLVVAGTVLGLIGGLGWLAVLGTPQVSCAAVQVEPVLADRVSRDAPVRRFVLMDNELAVLESEAVRTRAERLSGSPLPATAVTTTVPSNTEVLRFCVRDRSGARARDGAAALAEAYRQVRAEAVELDLTTRSEAAAAELARVRADLARASDVDDSDELSERVDELENRILLLGTARADGSRLLQEAQPPRADAEHRRLVLVPAVGLGLLAGCVAALRVDGGRSARSPGGRRTVGV